MQKCKSCGSERYEIREAYRGYRQRLLVVECGNCKYEIIPVVVDEFMPAAEGYAKCDDAWKEANEPPKTVSLAETPSS